ncbi:MAG: sugar transferase [Planctomycetes bacterium]|nr:sugar transferase [Planctomycetota bacterium]
MSRGSGVVQKGGGDGFAPAGWNLVERAVALGLLVLSLPVVLLLALYMRVTAGSPVLYAGTRLGRGQRPFKMLKLRTLRVGANQVTGGQLLGSRHELMVRGGGFLRDTRLDELPQLWNIVRGDMSFVGPRPERPEVVAAQCLGIQGYARRFEVRPGLIGISQLFTPHGTPKRYRTLIDNGLIRRGSGLSSLRIVAFTVWVVASEVLRRALRQLFRPRGRRSGMGREHRRLRRVAPHGAVVHLGAPGTQRLRASRLVDINEETLLVECEYEPGVERAAELVLDIPVRGSTRLAHRTARCTGEVAGRRPGPTGELLVIRYKPCSERSEYMVHQYFLQRSLATPRRSLNGSAPPFVPPATAADEKARRLSPG